VISPENPLELITTRISLVIFPPEHSQAPFSTGSWDRDPEISLPSMHP
jgi:hypothetical protein